MLGAIKRTLPLGVAVVVAAGVSGCGDNSGSTLEAGCNVVWGVEPQVRLGPNPWEDELSRPPSATLRADASGTVRVGTTIDGRPTLCLLDVRLDGADSATVRVFAGLRGGGAGEADVSASDLNTRDTWQFELDDDNAREAASVAVIVEGEEIATAAAPNP